MKNTNKILAMAMVCAIMVITFAFTPFKNLPTGQAGGKVIMIVTLEVNSFTEWKKGFDAGASVREKAGIKVLTVCSSIENEHQIVVVEEAESVQSAHDFITLLKSKQKEGTMAKLDVKLYNKKE